MDDEERQWEQPRFRDESDVSSEDFNLLNENSRPRPTVLQRPSFRLLSEALMIIAIIALSATVVTNKVRQTSKPMPYGPVSTYYPKTCSIARITSLTTYDWYQVREKVVTFGDNAGFGPDVVYADIDMLLNSTRMREVHESWQLMYPSKQSQCL